MNNNDILKTVAFNVEALREIVFSPDGLSIPASRTFVRQSPASQSEINRNEPNNPAVPGFATPSVASNVIFKDQQTSEELTYNQILALEQVSGPTLLLFHSLTEANGISFVSKISTNWLTKENLNSFLPLQLHKAILSYKAVGGVANPVKLIKSFE